MTEDQPGNRKIMPWLALISFMSALKVKEKGQFLQAILSTYLLLSSLQKGIDKEFHLLFTVFDENLSRYVDENIQRFAWRPYSVDKEDKKFVESNKMHGMINAFPFGK